MFINCLHLRGVLREVPGAARTLESTVTAGTPCGSQVAPEKTARKSDVSTVSTVSRIAARSTSDRDGGRSKGRGNGRGNLH